MPKIAGLSTIAGKTGIATDFLKWKIMIKRLFIIFSPPFLLFCFHGILCLLGINEKYTWLDIPLHILGGIFITYSFSLALKYFQQIKLLSELNLLSTSVFLFALAATAAVIWEFGEFASDFLFHTHSQPSLEDTMLDMFLGMLGGTALIVFLAKAQLKHDTKQR